MQEKQFLTALANNIRRHRESKNFSQTELANLIEIERPAMNRIESGSQNPTSKTLFKISRALGINVSDLFDFEIESD